MEQLNRFSPIGLFDSGVGGISVLKEAMRQMPAERFVFFGDTKNAPYGTKTKEEVLALSRSAVKLLLEEGCKAVVIACNTATSAAAATLRAEYPDLPIIGMEPAIKPAQQLRHGGIVLALATPGTIAGEKYARLYSLYGEGVESLPCGGLMEFAERGEMQGERLRAFLSDLFAPFAGRQVDAVVLGCTHYVFLRDAIAAHFPGVPLIDGNEGTVRHLQRRLSQIDLLCPADQTGSARLLSSGGEDAVQRMRRLLEA